jgi:hypothetical protein
LHIEKLLIESIWSTWNDSAASDKVYCGWRRHQFGLGLASYLPPTFLTAVQNMACSNKEGPLGDGCTLKHHLFDPFDGGHGMVQQLLCRDTRIVSSIVYTSD